MTNNPWRVDDWIADFGSRSNLRDELRVLDRVFPETWRQDFLVPGPARHRLVMDLAFLGSRARLLVLASGLLQRIGGDIGSGNDAQIPLVGRLRNSRLYPPMASEFLVGQLLGAIDGALTWQPEGFEAGCDFRMDTPAGTLVAEVKRPWTSEATLADQNAFVEVSRRRMLANQPPPSSRAMYSDAGERAKDQAEARRLYPHFRKAAKQLRQSAEAAAGMAWQSAPGILFIDVGDNWRIGNIVKNMRSWMERQWATPIDSVVLFDYRPRQNVWRISAQIVFARSDRAARLMIQLGGLCNNGHIHVPPCSPEGCEQQLFDM